MTAAHTTGKELNDNGFRLFLSRQQVAKRIRELARVISADYRGRSPVVIGVLNGGFIFMADLVRRLKLDVEIDFVKIASYGDSTTTSGTVHMTKKLDIPVANRHVLVVEDIVDSGLSIRFLQQYLLNLKPATLKFVSLLLKKNNTNNIKIDYIGFKVPNKFVVGYGLDYKQLLRNLPDIYIKQ